MFRYTLTHLRCIADGATATSPDWCLPLAIEHETVGDSEVQYFQLDYTKFIPFTLSAAT